MVVGGGGWLYWRARACLPQLDGTVQVAGLSAPVEVLRDARGVPHLRASSLEDLFFAQGYVTAQDRLWQMDLSRRLAEGELSEVFGERTQRMDIENRTLGFRQVSERALAELSPEARAPLTAYANGVNAFIASHQGRLPIEFLLLNYQPRPWREVDSLGVALNMAKTLSTTWGVDLMRERIRAKLGPELSADLFPDHSPLDEPVAELPPGSKLPPQWKDVYPPPTCRDPGALNRPVASQNQPPPHPLLRPRRGSSLKLTPRWRRCLPRATRAQPRSEATTGWSAARTPSPASRCSPMIRTSATAFPASGT